MINRKYPLSRQTVGVTFDCVYGWVCLHVWVCKAIVGGRVKGSHTLLVSCLLISATRSVPPSFIHALHYTTLSPE